MTATRKQGWFSSSLLAAALRDRELGWGRRLQAVEGAVQRAVSGHAILPISQRPRCGRGVPADKVWHCVASGLETLATENMSATLRASLRSSISTYLPPFG